MKCFRRKPEKTHEEFFSLCPQIIPMKGWNSLLTNDNLPMFFLQIDQRHYAKNPKSKTSQTISLPRNTCFAQKAPLATYNAVPTNLPQAFGRNLKKVLSSSKKAKTCQLLSSKCSYGEVECSFNNPAVVFCAKSPNFFGSSQKEKTYPKLFFPNDPSGHLQGSSDRDSPK